MMPAKIAIEWLTLLPISGDVLEDFKVRSIFAPKESQLFHDGTWMHIHMFKHPVGIVIFEWPEGVDLFAADDVHEEALGLIEIRHSESNVLSAA